MEYENKYASNSKGNAALTTGIIGTAGVGLGLLGNLLGTNVMGGNCAPACSENMPVTRYELGQESKIADLQSQIALRDANTYNDQKMLELYKYFDGKFTEVNGVLGAQAVQNQATKDSFQLLQERLECCKNEMCGALARERDERRCGDNAIVNYVNATFYPKMVADVTTGTNTTAQTVYNPLPVATCGGCC